MDLGRICPDTFVIEMSPEQKATNTGANDTFRGKVNPNNVTRIIYDNRSYSEYPADYVQALRSRFPNAEFVDAVLNDKEDGYVVLRKTPSINANQVQGPVAAPKYSDGTEVKAGDTIRWRTAAGKNEVLGTIDSIKDGVPQVRVTQLSKKAPNTQKIGNIELSGVYPVTNSSLLEKREPVKEEEKKKVGRPSSITQTDAEKVAAILEEGVNHPMWPRFSGPSPIPTATAFRPIARQRVAHRIAPSSQSITRERRVEYGP
jgi:hypothetical protein